ncbi:MAG: ABC transporter ATP-binding protein [Streptococcaceae bacterium]|jgi:ABC-2 type transport system ATP-binding protein|nr:ABC transporter ATP-binding protein [Streptococcaceae bacterium]
MEILSLKGVKKNFKKTKALTDVTLSVNSGEVLGFIGPNGAGKSTTIRVLLGVIARDGGDAKIFGKDVWKHPEEIHKRIAYVPGDVNLWPNLTGGEIIDFFMRLHGGGDQAKKDKLIQKFDFDPKKKAKSYSKGNRQKVSLIAALSTNADLYIFDEPTSGLDPLMESVFQEEVKRIKEEGKAILLSSHILSEVEKLCDRVAIIKNGKVIETGTLEDLRHLTRSTYRVETKEVANGLEELPYIHDLKQDGKTLVFQGENDKVEEILEILKPFGVHALQTTPPTLEELFIRHYEGK